MFKILLLQQWHTLSDPAAEEAVRDRLSFRRFCGLPLDMETPDHASIWRFRQTIDKLGLSVALLTEVNRQLDARGFVIKRGTLVDATIIAGAVRRPYEGGGVNPRDPEARFTRKRDKTYFGYKAHLAVDEESGLVRQAEMTSANVHDSRLGEALIQGFARDARTARRGRRNRLEGQTRPLSARGLAAAAQRLDGERALSRRARLRHDEALVWDGPRPLFGACPQRLSSAVRRHGDEHEAGARADARCLTRSQERRLRARNAKDRRPKRPNVLPPFYKTRYRNRNPSIPATHPLLQSSPIDVYEGARR
jgi:IS5 family transposase